MKKAMKFDKGKLPYHLVPWDAMDTVCAILRMGAEKYAPRNWEKGIEASRMFGAISRHMKDWFQYGIDKDEDSGLHPLAHVACDSLFVVALYLRGKLIDDRPKTKSSTLGRVPSKRIRGNYSVRRKRKAGKTCSTRI